jgi:tRNA threonylcarbamoyladenosine biosynthesis protein TsaE
MDTFISHHPDETLAWGERWALTARAGQVLALEGELGAGKTHLVKGIARGLGIQQRVQSPTFGLVLSYATGRVPLHHLDLYRLRTQEEAVAAGLDEFLFATNAIVVVEWPERWCSRAEKPIPWQWVRILSQGESDREIIHENSGA